MKVPFYDADTVRQALPMAVCVDLMASTQAALSAGEIKLPLRSSVPLEGGRSLLVMPGATNQPGAVGAKLLTIYPDNPAASLPAIQGCVMLFDPETGAPSALVEAASITALRTAAASGAATRALARSDARVLALLGYGVQAESHLEAMCSVREVTELRVWGPDLGKASVFAERASSQYPQLDARAAASPAAALEGAELVCAVSAARTPLITREMVSPGAHLNLVGAHTPRTREADADTLAAARVFTEINEFALAEAGNLLLAVSEGKMAAADVAGEIGAVINGKLTGRTSTTEITLYLSLGNVAQDLIAAQHVLASQSRSSHRKPES